MSGDGPDFSVSDDRLEVQAHVRRFCEGALAPKIAARRGETGWSRELWDLCGAQGLQGLFVPEELGGQGLDPLTGALAWEAFGRYTADGGLVFSIGAHLLASVVPIWKHGTDVQRRRWLPELCSGRAVACVGMTEDQGGSSPYDMATRAERDGEGFVLRGRKTFVTNAPEADVALVYAATGEAKGFGGGVSAFLVERGTPGFSAGQTFDTLGLETTALGELVLDDVRVGPEAMLGPLGGGGPIFDESMVWERTILASGHVGAMERLLDQAVRWARSRRVGGRPIATHQAVAHRIADMQVRLDAARLLARRAAWKLDRKRDVALDAAVAKLFVSEALLQGALDTIRVLGGYGFCTEYEPERVLRDAVGGVLYSGTSDIQRVIISGWVLGTR